MKSPRSPGSRPGGTPEEVSRGQDRASGRRPRKPCRVVSCPSGASKNWPGTLANRRGLLGPRRRATAETLRGGRCQKLLRCPAGARPVRHGNRGPRPLARACPRLISSGVPLGLRARRRRQFSGGLLATGAMAKSSCRARIFPGSRLGARCIRRSELAPWDAADSNGGLRGFGAAAAGPRRTQPRSLGCGSAALCSSCLCGRFGGFCCIDTLSSHRRVPALHTQPARAMRNRAAIAAASRCRAVR